MEHLTRKSSKWPRKTTASGMIPLLLSQALIVLFCVPQTLEAGTEIRREVAWEELHELLSEEKKVTVFLSEGGAVRSDRVTILSESIHLDHITKATNWKRYPWGSETSIAKDSVKEIRVEKMRGAKRWWGSIAGGAGGLGLAWLVIKNSSATEFENLHVASFATLLSAPCVGVGLGHWLGQRSDRETTILTIAD